MALRRQLLPQLRLGNNQSVLVDAGRFQVTTTGANHNEDDEELGVIRRIAPKYEGETPTMIETVETTETPSTTAAAEGAKQTEEPKVEAKAEPDAKPAENLEESLSEKFAKRAKDQRADREREKAQKATQEKLAKFEETLANGKKDPLKAIEALGLTYDDILDAVTGRASKETPESLEVKKLRDELAAKDQLAIENEKNRVISNAKAYIDTKLLTDEKHELLAASHGVAGFDAHEKIFSYIRLAADEGFEATVEEAAEAIESYLETQLLERLSKTKKLQKKLAVKATDDTKDKSDGPRRKESPTTLTNASTAGAPDRSGARKSYAERLKEAEEYRLRGASTV